MNKRGKNSKSKTNANVKARAVKEGNKLSFREQLELEEMTSELPSNSKLSKLSTVDDVSSRLDDVKVNLSKRKGRSVSKTRKNSDANNFNNLNNEVLSQAISHMNVRSLSQNNRTNKAQKLFESQFKKYEKFPYDNSIMKQIEIEFEVQIPEEYTQEEVKMIQAELEFEFNFFFRQTPFVYFEFSNPRGYTNYMHSFIDNINYDFLYERSNEDIHSGNKNPSTVIKDINYISAMSTLYRRHSRANFLNTQYEFYNPHMYTDFFYMVTPLVSMYFFKYEKTRFLEQTVSDVDDSGVLLSNYNRTMEKILKEFGVVYKILEKQGDADEMDSNNILKDSPSKNKKKYKKKNQPSVDLFSLPHNPNEVESLSNFINSNHEDQVSNFDSVIFIKNYYSTLFFNILINSYENSPLNIFAPFSFECSTFHECKTQVTSHVKNGKTIVVNANIYGCIFHIYLQKLMEFLTGANFLIDEEEDIKMGVDEEESNNNQSKKGGGKKSERKYKTSNNNNIQEQDGVDKTAQKNTHKFQFNFSMRFVHFLKTSNFASVNKLIPGPVERMQYKDKAFYIKTYSNQNK